MPNRFVILKYRQFANLHTEWKWQRVRFRGHSGIMCDQYETIFISPLWLFQFRCCPWIFGKFFHSWSNKKLDKQSQNFILCSRNYKLFKTSSSIFIPDILSTKYLNTNTGFFFLDFFYVSEEPRKESAPPPSHTWTGYTTSANKNYKRGRAVVAWNGSCKSHPFFRIAGAADKFWTGNPQNINRALSWEANVCFILHLNTEISQN